jgi:DNA-binding HxlR family transcriptional regulator
MGSISQGATSGAGSGWWPGVAGWQDVDASQCSIAHAADVVGDRWSLLLLREIALGVDRFDAMQTHLGASRRTMADRLDALVRHGVVERVPHKDPGQRLRHRYRLTAAGEDLRPLLQALGDWGAKHRPDDVGPSVTVSRCGCGAPTRLEFKCTEGHTAPAAEPRQAP